MPRGNTLVPRGVLSGPCLALALALGAGPAMAGESHLGAELGAINLQLNDELVRGLRWNGWGGELKVFFERQDDHQLWRADVRIPAASLKNRYGHQGISWNTQVDVGWAKRVATLGDSLTLSVGARLRWDWSVAYYVDFDEEHLFWLNSDEVAPLAVLNWQAAPAHRVSAELDSAVLALVSRPPARRYYKIDKLTHPFFYFTKTHEAMRVASVPGHATARLRLLHEVRLGLRASLKTTYSLDYAYESQPVPVQVLVHSISTGVAYVF